jgi:hypothetical protein
MEQTPWEANGRSASQEIPCLHYRAQKSQLLLPILNHMKPVHIFLPYFTNTHSNIILSVLFPSRFPNKVLYGFRISSMCAAYPADLIFLDMITLTMFRNETVRSIVGKKLIFLWREFEPKRTESCSMCKFEFMCSISVMELQ